MRKGLKWRMIAATCLLALILPLALPANAAKPDRYGYSLLTNENQKLAYRKLADGIGACESTITFEMENVTQETLDDVLQALSMISRDYPEFFWFPGGGKAESLGNTVTVTPTQYRISGTPVSAGSSELQNAKAALDAAVSTALAQLPAGASDYLKAEILHDYLAGKVTYQSSPDDQTAYGALVLGQAVCAGYTRAYQYLLNEAGIRSWYVSGQSMSPQGQQVAHAWNLVWLDENCYYTDVTWDDQGDRLFHHYLNLSWEQMAAGHATADPIPASCGHTTYTYFKMNAAPGKGICDLTGSESGGDIAKYFVLQSQTGDQAVYFCTLHYHGDDFSQWIGSQIQAICETLNLTGRIGYSYASMGIEYQITITGTLEDSSSAPSQPSVPSGGGTVTPQPSVPSGNTQTSEPTVPTTPPETQSEQAAPTTQISPSAATVTTETTTLATEPTGESSPAATTVSASTTEPSAPTEIPKDKPVSPAVPIAISVLVILAGVLAIILVRRSRK